MEENKHHYMLKEILEQPKIIGNVCDQKNSHQIHQAAEIILDSIHREGKIFLVGSGSSYHSCLFAQALLASFNHIVSQAIMSGELEAYIDEMDKDDVVIAVSQSGENSDILENIDKIKKKGARIVGLTNEHNSHMDKKIKLLLPLMAGKEYAVPATKTFMAEIMIFYALVEVLNKGHELGRDKKEIIRSVIRVNDGNYRVKMNDIIKKVENVELINVLGEHLFYSISLESALKIKEATQIEAQGYQAGEFLHGPITLANKNTLSVVFVPDDDERGQLLEIISKIKKGGGQVLGIGPKKEAEFDYYLKIDDIGIFTPIPAIVVMQMLAYELAISKNLNPDRPKGLAKVIS